MLSRRTILITGASAIVVVGAYRELHSDLGKARAPWKQAGKGFGDPRLDALSYAILAPSPHNRQPWLVRLDSDDRLTLYCDLNRLLPETDPLNRQIVIGFGAFLELLRQAAAELGYRIDVEAFPEGEPKLALDDRPVAQVRFVSDISQEKDLLFGAALMRRTVRTPFDQKRPVDAETLNTLNAALRPTDGEFEWANDENNIRILKEICREGWRTEVSAPGPYRESTRLTRIGEKEINQSPDGISLSGPVIEGTRLAKVLTREKMNEEGSLAHKETLNFYNGLIDTSMAFGWLSTAGNSRTDQLRAGAGWIRLHLAATREDLAVQPLSQVLQEFPEMSDLLEEFHDFAGVELPARVQGLFRFGYAKAPLPSPRWPLVSRLVVDA